MSAQRRQNGQSLGGTHWPVFCWHMTALVAFLGLYQRAGLTLVDRATVDWWPDRASCWH